jgi:Flp pilus assembly protein TadD
MSHYISPAAESSEGLQEFKEGLSRLRHGEKNRALEHVLRALRVEPRNAFYLSYAGLLSAVAEARFDVAERFCQDALSLKWNHAQLYLNLAEVYLQAGRSPEAVEVLQKGLLSAGRDYRIRRALERIGVRRGPVVPWLERTHALNRALGRIRHRISGSARAL